MSTTASPNLSPPGEPSFRLSVDQYHAMMRAGILTEEDAVELLEGLLIRKMSQNPPHSVSTELLASELRRLAPDAHCVRQEKPITLADSEPEPDVAVARGATRTYATRHPSAADVALVVEVADATLERDRGIELRVYARAAIPAYWIVNLVDRQVEVFTGPSGAVHDPSYASCTVYPNDSEIPVILEGRQVGVLRVAELIP